MEVSVIISVYNDWTWLEMIFAALSRQNFREGSFEVVIADDGSGDRMRESIAAAVQNRTYPFPIVHVWHEDLGWRKNIILNAAVRASRGDYLMFLDGDCIPHRQWLKEHWESRMPGVVIGGRRANLPRGISQKLTPHRAASGYLPRALPLIVWGSLRGDGSLAENAIRLTWGPLRRFIKAQHSIGLIGCNFSIFKNDLMRVNGFDERFLDPATGEDTDLEARLQRAGMTVVILKHMAVVYHKNHRAQSYVSSRNAELFEENNRGGVTYTPHGINRSE